MPQTEEEKEAVAARKVQRVVKKRLLRAAVAARRVQRVMKRQAVRAKKAGEAKEQKKRAAAEYELEWEACWGGSTLSKRCRWSSILGID
jgi:hypothetical protein